jgi:citrate synthase
MGKKTFTEVMLMQILGRSPRPVDLRITDVVLIVLMEHGSLPAPLPPASST